LPKHYYDQAGGGELRLVAKNYSETPPTRLATPRKIAKPLLISMFVLSLFVVAMAGFAVFIFQR
jgi:hypothetical protein